MSLLGDTTFSRFRTILVCDRQTDRQIVRQDDHIYRASIALAGNENYTPLTTQFVQPNCIVFKYCFTIIIEDDKQ